MTQTASARAQARRRAPFYPVAPKKLVVALPTAGAPVVHRAAPKAAKKAAR